MAHEILETPLIRVEKKSFIKFPKFTGKFGISLELGKKSLFFGLIVSDIEEETVIKRKKVHIEKGKVTYIPTPLS